MRKVSAHYCLLPDGSLGKWPVIVLDENGRIEEMRVNASKFREESGLEYSGGVIIPGFIEDLRGVSFSGFTENEIKRNLNRFQAQGSIRFLLENKEQSCFFSRSKSVWGIDEKYENKERSEFAGISVWDRVRDKAEEDGDFVKAIFDDQSEIRDGLPKDLKWGRIETGYAPGLILLKGLDLDGMRLTANTKIKILNY